MRCEGFMDRKCRCRQCGRVFHLGDLSAEDWGYTSRLRRREGKPVALCSYRCLREWEAPALARKRARIEREFALAAMGTSIVEMQQGRNNQRYQDKVKALADASTVTK